MLSVRPTPLHLVALTTRAVGLPAALALLLPAQTAIFFTMPTQLILRVAEATLVFTERLCT